ncbi:hypothetical protein SLEP1_g43940 [Rubroshorea leprosula]|uniref:Uncharacterized protein n=1 Tax=Rubroshorea leprosula TaxID=152421 RepID=A0AAV5LEN8_9ROSI|nr:hypothetical protein SLEP1_g43940 [Rubroshorea leprosula]
MSREEESRKKMKFEREPRSGFAEFLLQHGRNGRNGRRRSIKK